MSPDASVHEDQLREIERQRKRYPKRRRRGCLFFFALTVFLSVIAFLWFERDLYYRDGKFQFGNLKRELSDRGKALRRKSPAEILEDLQKKVEGVQKRFDEMVESDEIRGRLESLREDLARKKTAGSKALQKGWGELAGKSQALVDKVKEKGKEAPRELKELLATFRKLEEAEKKLSGATEQKQEGVVGKEERKYDEVN